MTDALKAYQPKTGMFVTIKSGSEGAVKLKVLTTDPLVHGDKFGNTRYAFVVWDINEEQPKILDKGYSIFGRIRDIHLDPDFGEDIRKLDIKISATGEGKETRYSVDVLPSKTELTTEQIKEAAKLELEKIIEWGIRLSEINEGKEMPVNQNAKVDEDEGEGYAKAKATARKIDGKEDVVIEDIGDEPINLDDIPF